MHTSVRHAHTVASESAISDHMTAPELPEPDATMPSNLRQLFAFPTCRSSLSPCSSHFPHLPPLLSAKWTQVTYSQDAPPTTHQAFSAAETWITHIGLANNKPEGDIASCCMCSTLPSLTVPRIRSRRNWVLLCIFPSFVLVHSLFIFHFLH